VRGLAKYDPSRGALESWLWRIVVGAARDSARRPQHRIIPGEYRVRATKLGCGELDRVLRVQ
jgi:hypothetical protein